MKFALLVYVDQARRDAQTTDQREAWYDEHRTLNARLEAAGARLYGTELKAPTTATTVRTLGGTSVLSDGPFAELTEHLRGVIVIEAANMDEAAAHAATLSDTIEIRPLPATPNCH